MIEESKTVEYIDEKLNDFIDFLYREKIYHFQEKENFKNEILIKAKSFIQNQEVLYKEFRTRKLPEAVFLKVFTEIFTLHRILTDTLLKTSKKRKILSDWIKIKFPYIFSSQDEFEQGITNFWNSYLNALKFEKDCLENITKFVFSINFYTCLYKNQELQGVINNITEFFTLDKLKFPYIVISDELPPLFKQVSDYESLPEGFFETETYVKYDESFNLIKLYRTGIMWIAEKYRIELKPLIESLLLLGLIRFFLAKFSFDTSTLNKVSFFFLKRILENRKPEVLEDLYFFEDFKIYQNLDFIDEFTDSEIIKFDNLLNTPESKENNIISEFIFEFNKNKAIKGIIISNLLNDFFEKSGKDLFYRIRGGRFEYMFESIEDCSNEIRIKFDRYFQKSFQITKTKLEVLKLRPDIKDFLFSKVGNYKSEEEFFKAFDSELISEYKYLLYDTFIKRRVNRPYKYKPVNLFFKMQYGYIDNLVLEVIGEDKANQITSFDETWEEDDTPKNEPRDKTAEDFENNPIAGENYRIILKFLYKYFVNENFDSKVISVFFLDRFLDMQKQKVAESLKVSEGTITDINYKIDINLIYIFNCPFEKHIKRFFYEKDLMEINFALLVEKLNDFRENALDLRKPNIVNELKNELENAGIEVGKIKETFFDHIKEALLAFQVKQFYQEIQSYFDLTSNEIIEFKNNFLRKITLNKTLSPRDKYQILDDMKEFAVEKNKTKFLEALNSKEKSIKDKEQLFNKIFANVLYSFDKKELNLTNDECLDFNKKLAGRLSDRNTDLTKKDNLFLELKNYLQEKELNKLNEIQKIYNDFEKNDPWERINQIFESGRKYGNALVKEIDFSEDKLTLEKDWSDFITTINDELVFALDKKDVYLNKIYAVKKVSPKDEQNRKIDIFSFFVNLAKEDLLINFDVLANTVSDKFYWFDNFDNLQNYLDLEQKEMQKHKFVEYKTGKKDLKILRFYS